MLKIHGKEIMFTKFPNKETLVDTKILNEINECKESFIRIDFKWNEDEDLLHLYFVLNHIKCNFGKSKPIKLYIYYMPYSRMDRNQNGNCFTLLHVSSLLNSVLEEDDKVMILEPHSSVTTNLINNSERINVITPLMNHILKLNPDIDVICYPDKGAKARFQDDKVIKPVVYCEKIRDFNTGNITGLELINIEGINLEDKNVLILDDLCSKGGTFYYTSKRLKECGVNKVYLGVCHMEETITQGELLQEIKNFDEVEKSFIERIYCLDTMLLYGKPEDIMENYDNITIYDTEKFLLQNDIERFMEVDTWKM